MPCFSTVIFGFLDIDDVVLGLDGPSLFFDIIGFIFRNTAQNDVFFVAIEISISTIKYV